jgi:hypothetical protein
MAMPKVRFFLVVVVSFGLFRVDVEIPEHVREVPDNLNRPWGFNVPRLSELLRMDARPRKHLGDFFLTDKAPPAHSRLKPRSEVTSLPVASEL